MIWLLGGYMWLFIHRPFEIWPLWGTLHVERTYMLLTLIWWLAVARKEWIKSPLNPAFLLFGVVMLASWALSPYSNMGDKPIQDWLKVATFYVLVMSTIRDEKSLKRLTAFYLIAVGLYVAHSLWEYRNGRFQWTMGTRRLLGIDITFGDPNTFAATILYSLPLVTAFWPHAQRVWQRGLLAGGLAMAAGCILLTSSRSGFVGLVFLMLMTVLMSRHRLRWMLLLAVLAPPAWLALPVDRQNRFLTLIDPKYGPANAQESAEGRAKGWHDGLAIWSRYPLLGVGPGAFKAASGSGYESHHLYGQILGELGALGAVAFSGLLCAFFSNVRNVRRLCRENPEFKGGFSYSIVRATTQTVLLMLLMGLSGHNLYRYTWLWFGAFQAIALYVMRQQAGQWDEVETEVPQREPLETVPA